jgi:predicted nucleic acid-binding Zn ribbon protein
MELIHCIYCSAATDEALGHELLEEILKQSQSNNKKAGITGMLLFDSGTFFQVLEGDKSKVEKLYSKIRKDPRHERVRKLIAEPIEERAFGEWSMGYPRITNKELREIPGLNDFFSEGNSFLELEEGRAKTLLRAFQQGKWHG